MTNLNKLADMIDSPAATNFDEEGYCDDCNHSPCTCVDERPDPYDEAMDRQAVERDVQGITHEMSDLGRFLFESAQAITRVYVAGMKAGR